MSCSLWILRCQGMLRGGESAFNKGLLCDEEVRFLISSGTTVFKENPAAWVCQLTCGLPSSVSSLYFYGELTVRN